ncbi:hypothetical protein [Nocardiopsis synnemataformans]|uniref:hypothetical protein n=1 Tax=Nocardiopsis synnemataformans TaxID=61305 RepID=UPI003EB7236A
MTFPPAPTTAAESWEVVHGPVAMADIDRLAREVADRHHLHPTRTSDGMHLSASAHDGDPLLRLTWRPPPPVRPRHPHPSVSPGELGSTATVSPRWAAGRLTAGRSSG